MFLGPLLRSDDTLPIWPEFYVKRAGSGSIYDNFPGCRVGNTRQKTDQVFARPLFQHLSGLLGGFQTLKGADDGDKAATGIDDLVADEALYLFDDGYKALAHPSHYFRRIYWIDTISADCDEHEIRSLLLMQWTAPAAGI